MAEQRNQQQEQLHKLKMLVAELIKEKNIGYAETDMNGTLCSVSSPQIQ